MHSWGDIIKEGILKRKNLKVNGHSVSVRRGKGDLPGYVVGETGDFKEDR